MSALPSTTTFDKEIPAVLRHSLRGGIKRPHQGSDVTVLENPPSALLPLHAQSDIHHGPGQVVGRNDLVGKQHAKGGVEPTQQAIAEIRFLPRLHGIDVRRAATGEWRGGPPPRKIVPSRPRPCSARRVCDYVPSGPRHFRSRMRTPPRGCCCGKPARIRSCSPRLSGGAPRPAPPRYTRPGKRVRRPDPRAPPQVPSSPRTLDAEPLSASGAKCRASCVR